jgi:hypothetical protein
MKKIIMFVSIVGFVFVVGCADMSCGPSISSGAGPLFYPDGKVDPWSLTPGFKCKF